MRKFNGIAYLAAVLALSLTPVSAKADTTKKLVSPDYVIEDVSSEQNCALRGWEPRPRRAKLFDLFIFHNEIVSA